MRRTFLGGLVFVAVAIQGCAPATPVATQKQLLSKEEIASYAIGMNIGSNMKKQNLEVNGTQVAAGLTAAYSGSETLLSEDEMIAALTEFQKDMQEKQMAQMAKIAEENLSEAKGFLAINGAKEGVVTTESGLQYKVITSGNGPAPSEASTVKVHYTGTLIDGTKFDSSYDRNEPVSFPVSGVIAGWTEALVKMKVGDKWQLVIPPDLAYGEDGAPPTIPANAALIFEVELLEIL